MPPANLVYFGSPDFSAEILASLLPTRTVLVVGVVTNPDKPRGRKQVLTPSPVAAAAAKYDLPVFKPVKLDDAHLHHLKLLKPDLFLVIAYGQIIPRSYLDTPTIGTFNIHFSLLPRYRGALPISEALKNGDQETGVSLMQMDEALDHGPIISQTKVGIDINDNCQTLTTKLTQAGIKLLADRLPSLAQNKFTSKPQEESATTLTPSTKTRTRQNAFIPWEKIKAALDGQDALAVHNLIRSANPDPAAWTKIDSQELKIIKTSLLSNQLVIESVQLPGKPVVSWRQFVSGHPQWRS